MKDFIKRILIALVSGSLFGYILFLFLTNQTIVQTGFLEFNMIYTIVLLVSCLYLLVFFAVYPIYLKISKATVFVLGLALIILGDSVLTNIPEKAVYIADIIKLFGVILTLLSWTNVLITDKIKEEKKNKNIEIIEV